MICLKGILPHSDYDCWKLFVKACFLLCQCSISKEQAANGDSFLRKFLELFVQLYGSQKFTPNMHLHGHLVDCIYDYGPIYSFWLFAFKRLNGILGAYNTSSHHISLQLMKRFLDHSVLQPESWPTGSDFSEFSSLIRQSHVEYTFGSLSQSTVEEELSTSHNVKFLPPVTEKGFKPDELAELHWVKRNEDENLLILYQQCKSIKTSNGKFLASTASRYARSSVVLVQDFTKAIRLAEIQFFAKCFIEKSYREEILACIKLFASHVCKVWFGAPVQVWSRHFECGTTYIPVSFIKCRAVYADIKVDFGRFMGVQAVRVAIPLEYSSEIFN